MHYNPMQTVMTVIHLFHIEFFFPLPKKENEVNLETKTEFFFFNLFFF